MKQAVILCGGLGTRLRSVVGDRPKVMADVNGKPFLEHLVNHLKLFEIRDFVFCTGYMGDYILDYFGDGSKRDISIIYSHENQPLGTGGALKNAEALLDREFYLLNGDTLRELDYQTFRGYHIRKQAMVTISVVPMHDAGRYGTIIMDEDGRIIRFLEKNPDHLTGYINGGVYIANKNILKYMPLKYLSFEKEVLPQLITQIPIYGYVSGGYFIDIGLPEDYAQFKSATKRECT